MADDASAPDLSIIVVSFNTRDYTLACLRSVREQTRGVDYELLVVDNASRDGSAEAIAREHPEARLFALDENLGFGRANNLAAREARGRRLLLLNPDTLVLDGAVQKLHDFAVREAPHDVVGGRTFFADGSLNPGSCWGAPSLWSLFCMASGLSQLLPGSTLTNPHALGAWPRDTVREVGVVAGCLLLIPRDLWERLGGFDTAFFMYAEDVDLCLRARAAGARCIICPDARIVHYAGASEQVRADKMVRLFRARTQLMRKHWPGARAWLGVRLLELWALLRVAAFGAARLAAPRLAGRHRTWLRIWGERDAWAAMPAASAVPDGPAGPPAPAAQPEPVSRRRRLRREPSSDSSP